MQSKTLLTGTQLSIEYQLSLDSLEVCLAKAWRALHKAPDRGIHFDLSRVLWVDIGSLLFLTCVLSYLKRQGIPFSLTLPEINSQWAQDPVRKVRDFLKRWKFDAALWEAVGDLTEIVPPRQEDYFEMPLKYYREGEIWDTDAAVKRLLSCRLVEITHMTRGPVGNRKVSEEEINKFLNKMAIEKRFRQAVCDALGYDDETYKEFGSTIVYEALLNTFEHPEASLSMIAMARQTKHLVVAIADNGDTIPDTIREQLEQEENVPRTVSSKTDDLRLLEIATEAHNFQDYVNLYIRDYSATDYATLPGTTSKKHIPRRRRGFGLTYVKDRVIEFGGYIVFRAGAASVRYFVKDGVTKHTGKAVSPWSGNLIKIFLPLTPKALKGGNEES